MIKVFYHCYLVNGWEALITEQINNIINSGLYDTCEDITVTISGKEIDAFKDLIKPYKKMHIGAVELVDKGMEESLALTLIREYALKSTTNDYVLYMHTKGISREGTNLEVPTRQWRKAMDHFNIIKWRDCVHVLDRYSANACGIFYGKMNEHNAFINTFQLNDGRLLYQHQAMFSGNYWWSTCNHLKTLPPLSVMPKMRIAKEAWVLYVPFYKVYSFLQTSRNLFDEPITEDEYSSAKGELFEVSFLKELPTPI